MKFRDFFAAVAILALSACGPNPSDTAQPNNGGSGGPNDSPADQQER